MALSPITINGASIRQPSRVREYKEHIQSEKTSVDGSMQRNRLGFKYVAELTWDRLPVADFGSLESKFTTGSGIYYRNPSSKYGVLAYSGLPFTDESEYERGESLLSTYKVRIREI